MLFGFRKHKSIENHQYFKQLSIFFDKMVINIRAKAADFTADFVHQHQSARALLLELIAENDRPSVAYSTVYPLAMFLRIVLAQTLILIFA